MSPPQFSNPTHQYPQEIQLRLYQAFIFSIPILFSVILFLLFYLFYLKRRASSVQSEARFLPVTIDGSDNTITTTTSRNSDSKGELFKNKLCRVSFDEYMETKDSMCCVCLGEYIVKEELVQVERCKHVFHEGCIRLWLHMSSTCPLCRALVGRHSNSYHKNSEPQSSRQLPGNSEVSVVIEPHFSSQTRAN